MKLTDVLIDNKGRLSWNFTGSGEEEKQLEVKDINNDGKLTQQDFKSLKLNAALVQSLINTAKDYNKAQLVEQLFANVYQGCEKSGPRFQPYYNQGAVEHSVDTNYQCGDLSFGYQIKII